LDVLIIGLGFVLRVAAGAFAISLEPTGWLLAITYALALLLGFGKRFGELQLMTEEGMALGETRLALKGYSSVVLRNLVSLAAFVVAALYMAYCLTYRREQTIFLVTLLPVLMGIFTYLRIACRSDEAEMPERLIFSSRTLLVSVLLWLLLILLLS
jgi:4-hydroxybenzoate polyprenyltransferase